MSVFRLGKFPNQKARDIYNTEGRFFFTVYLFNFLQSILDGLTCTLWIDGG